MVRRQPPVPAARAGTALAPGAALALAAAALVVSCGPRVESAAPRPNNRGAGRFPGGAAAGPKACHLGARREPPGRARGLRVVAEAREETVAITRTSDLPVRAVERADGSVAPGLIRDILLSGAGAALASATVAAAAARAEGKGALQPLNATSHWLHGQAAGRVRRLDGSHSGVGIGTHVLSALFWAVPYALWLRRDPGRSAGAVVAGAAATAVVAAAVDYGAMPRRLTPGWELAIGRGGIAATFVGLGLGLAAGALVARRLR